MFFNLDLVLQHVESMPFFRSCVLLLKHDDSKDESFNSCLMTVCFSRMEEVAKFESWKETHLKGTAADFHHFFFSLQTC